MQDSTRVRHRLRRVIPGDRILPPWLSPEAVNKIIDQYNRIPELEAEIALLQAENAELRAAREDDHGPS